VNILIKQNPIIALTIDVEPNTTEILQRTGSKHSGLSKAMPRFLEIVNCNKVPVTWFVTHDNWSKVDQDFPLLVENMNDNGEIGCHVHFRRNKEVYYKDYNFQSEIVGDATRGLRSQGFNVQCFRGGANFFDETTVKVLKELDYKVDSSVVPGLFAERAPGFEANHKQRLFAKPYFLSAENHCMPGDSGILEIPLSVCTYFRLHQKKVAVAFGRAISICRPAQNLIKDIKTLESESLKLFGQTMPAVLTAHPYDFLDNIDEQMRNLEAFINKAKEELNAEFVTLQQVREKYVNKNYSLEFDQPKFILTSQDLLQLSKKLPILQKLLKRL
jgi:hypothetical protein